MPMRLSFLLAAILLTNVTMESAQAQSILDRAKRATKDAVGREVEGVADRAATAAIGATEDAIICAANDERCIRRARRDNKELVIVDRDGKPVSHENAPAGAGVAAGSLPSGAAAPGQGAWANYDFVPGSRVLFHEDYANDRVGNFPRRLEFRSGNMEIVEWEGGRALRVNSRGAFDIRLPDVLPDGFTIEFDAYVSSFVNDFKVYPVDAEGKAAGPQHVQVDPYGGVGIASFDRRRDALSALQPDRERIEHRMTPVRVMADGAYIKVFLEETRVANVPNANLGRSPTLRFDFNDVRDQPIYLGPIHVAASDRSLYDSLRADGRVATHGILFATGSATIRPESTPTLEDIADALRRDSSLRLRVEGHTDNVGDPGANQRLSEQRAQAVVEFLVRNKGVAADRLEAAGLGQSQPAADNGTPEGRQTNRRVELVAL
jgi:OmpA-OmpF porin, OOP family